MSKYDRVLDVLEEHDLSFMDMDRIVVDPETYEDLQQRVENGLISNYSTVRAPAVRVTTKNEYLLYVDEDGQEVKINL